MTFIGFIAEREDEEKFRGVLKDFFKQIGIKAIIVAINEKSIHNIKNIYFETIIVDRNLKNINGSLKIGKYIILNEDCADASQFENINSTVITYGFGGKCTITASSVEEERIMICLQRNVNNIKNVQVEPQEISIKNDVNYKNKYLYMALGAIKLIYN